MKKAIFFLFILILYNYVLAYPIKRIKFPKGQTRVNVKGYLDSYKDSQTYLLRVLKGQSLMITSEQRITLTVLSPDGKDVMDRDLSCNSRAEISPTVAGDYKIIVVECQKADSWKGDFNLTVIVQ